MRNLKLVRASKKTVIESDSFCQDFDNFIYFSSSKGIYHFDQVNNEVSFCSGFDSEEQEYVIGMEYIMETNSIFLASASGNLYLYDIAEKQVSNIGAVENGLKEFAWSPDQEFLILLTGQRTFVLMTKEFDPITEKELSPEEFGQSKPINVGWGSKTTQFHGSEGKGAALIRQKEPTSALPHDDKLPRISWRNDGEYFVISSIDEVKGYRLLRIWSKDAILQFTSEVLEGIEEPLSWRPSGDFIVCSQQSPNKHKIIFVEKNGLKHLEFTLPFKPNTFKVSQLSWSNDSSVLAVVATELSDNFSDCQVMLWTTGNYHWYMKQRLYFQRTALQKSVMVKWSLNDLLELNCYDQAVSHFYNFKWIQSIFHSPAQYECEDSLVVSIDNESILISPFGKLVVPPPMCGYKFNLNSSVQSVFFAPDTPSFGAYLGNYKLAIFSKGSFEFLTDATTEKNECTFQLQAAGGNGFKSQVLPYSFQTLLCIIMDPELSSSVWPLCLSHWTWVKNNLVLCICQHSYEKKSIYSLLCVDLNSPSETKGIAARKVADLDKSVVAMCTNRDGSVVAIQYESGMVNRLEIDKIINSSENANNSLIQHWEKSFGDCLVLNHPSPEMCIVNKVAANDYGSIAALAPNGDFIFPDHPATQFVTSYFVQGGFLFYTNTKHVLNIHQYDATQHNGKLFPKFEQKIERNAKIVFVPPRSTKVILQMPRGNLETIHPRPLVLVAIFEDLDRLEYKKAFEIAKVHRIDLNFLFDYNPKLFVENIKLFTEQVQSKDLNLFLASLKIGNILKETYHLQLDFSGLSNLQELNFFNNKVNMLCDKIREVLDPELKEHLLPYLATYALMKPSGLDKALLKIKSIKDSGSLKNTQDTINHALDFLLYLVNVNELIDVAFGTYDLPTTIMVAQKSQKDPKEFLPFYNELQNLEENYRKYKIDMHLNRFKKALEHISKCADHFEECLTLIKEKKLYVDALYLYPPSSQENKTIWTEYGMYLESKGYHDEAGLVFSRVEADEFAFKAYRESANWKEALNLAYKLKYNDQKVLGTCQYIVERLKDKRKYLEAGYLLEHFVKDIEEAVVTLIEGYEWSSALLLMSKYNRYDIAETHLHPSLIMLHKTLIPELDLLIKDFNTHLSRLKYLRSPEKKKLDEEVALSSKYNDDDLFSEVTSVSDIASSQSESARLSGSIMTRKSSKSRRKQQLKKYRLKEGSPDEDLALIVALSEIVRKVDGLKDNFLNNVRVLLQHGLDSPAKEIQSKMQLLVSSIDAEMSYIWPINQTIETAPTQWSYGPDSTVNSITASRNVEEKNITTTQIDPQLAAPPWRKLDIFLNMLHIDVKCK
ncbi:putative elongator complex protein 1 isoform X5 [Parasteatoda tepidariorum]|uniref:putative elongator complex protein 1 isoform X5 n=1 Tax=Parasteatoda tepidariorum TaxID=114398 RepID=UPI0039BC7808